MQAQPATDAPAWQTLASAWGAALPAGADACTTLPREGLRCYRNRRAGLNLVRQIDRPVLLALYPSEEAEAPVSVLLRGLDGDNATLEGGGRSLRVPVAELAQVWRGEIATLWRAPVGMPDRGEITDSQAGAAWLDQRLAGREWATDHGFSLADCAAAPALFYADWSHPIDDRFVTLKAYRARLLARPSMARVVDEARPYRAYFPLGAPDRD